MWILGLRGSYEDVLAKGLSEAAVYGMQKTDFLSAQ